MGRVLWFVGLAAAIAVTGTAEVYLKDDDGSVFGPLRGVADEEIAIRGRVYRVAAPADPDVSFEHRLWAIRIPQLECVEASLHDVLEFLRSAASQIDPEGADIRIAFDERLWIASHEALHRLYGRVRPEIAEIPITLKLADIPLHDALRYTADVAGLAVNVANGRVVVRPSDEPDRMIHTRRWVDPERNYSVQNTPQARALLERTKAIEIPVVQFRNAYVEDALRFLQLTAHEIDVDEVNLVFVDRLPLRASDCNDPAAIERGGRPAPLPTVTMDLREIPLFDALRYVSDIVGLVMRFEDQAIVLRPASDRQADVVADPGVAGKPHQAVRRVADAAALAEIGEHNRTINAGTSAVGAAGPDVASTRLPLYLSDYRVEENRPTGASPGTGRRLGEFLYTLRDRIDAPPHMRRFTVTVEASFSGPGRAVGR